MILIEKVKDLSIKKFSCFDILEQSNIFNSLLSWRLL